MRGQVSSWICLSVLASILVSCSGQESGSSERALSPAKTPSPVGGQGSLNAGGEGSAATPVPAAEEPKLSANPDTAAKPQAAPTEAAPSRTATDAVYGGSGTTPATTAPQSPGSAAGDRKTLSWYYMKKGKGQVPRFPADTAAMTGDRKALWVGTGKKVYLTIDTGGALGDKEELLRALKDNGAKANFFIAGYNVKKDPEFIRRIVQDGHLLANHTMTHKDMTLMTDDEVRKEITDFAALVKEVTGQPDAPYFRFPYGRYSQHLVKLVSDMGYTSVFWSTAMRDWEPRKNGAEDPYNDIMGNLHEGNIILMHQGSPENIEALDRIVRSIQQAGYTFARLDELEPPK
ncbi:polysaccharide deacetylase family protein [Paenibacillus sp. YYML68]|uniref:polysaccharide deacetylase family protein n=1 Tax=Paenibacillus sp. YYML68 TaxID=2909250 RepID=UPI00249364AE|nr:polysaccharide deacetylase family protein [Paenibacillus sp. YYML68]